MLSGCAEEQPGEVVARAMAAFGELDAEAMAECFCAEQVQEVLSSRAQMNRLKADGGTIELVAVRYDLVREEAGQAEVRMSGTLKAFHPVHGDTREFLSEAVHLKREGGHWKICGKFL